MCVVIHPSSSVATKRSSKRRIDDFIGQYFYIKIVHEGAKKSTIYDQWNNVFVYVVQLHRRMVELYNITLEQYKGNLKFIVKLDLPSVKSLHLYLS